MKDQRELSLSNFLSIIGEHEVRDVLLSANISSTEYEFLVPKKDERANRPPEGYISVYKQQIVRGLRFPLHELVVEICNCLKVSPSPLRSMSHSMIVGFILCAKLYDLPITADCFFSLFRAKNSSESGELVLLNPISSLNFLEQKFSPDDVSKRKFFFLRPVGKSWNCQTQWNGSFCCPKIDASLRISFQDLAVESGIMYKHFRLNELIQKDVLVHGGIEPGIPSPQLTFRYMMNRAVRTKFDLRPEDIPPANATKKATKKRPLSADASIPNTLAEYYAAPSSSKVTNHDTTLSSCKDTGPKECYEDHAAVHKKANCAVLVSDEAPPQSLSAPLLTLSKTLESMFVAKDCYEKLEKEKKEVTAELIITKSRVQELELENVLYKAKTIESELRTFNANVKLKILEKRLENLKSESNSVRDKIKNEVIEEFKSSDDFATAVHEEAVTYYINGFETCKMQVLTSGKLPTGFNFDFLDVADAECSSSPGTVDNTAVHPDNKSKREKV